MSKFVEHNFEVSPELRDIPIEKLCLAEDLMTGEYTPGDLHIGISIKLENKNE